MKIYLIMHLNLKFSVSSFLFHLELKLVKNAVKNIWSVGQIPFEENK